MTRIALALAIGLPLCVQTPAQTPQSESQTLTSLLAEVQRLRLAIERSTVLGTRTQIAMQRMQIQELRAARLAQELDQARKELSDNLAEHARLAASVKQMEEDSAQATDPNARKELQEAIKQQKIALEAFAAREERARARETERAGQLQLEQSRLTELQNRIEEMERALDAAIRQLTPR